MTSDSTNGVEISRTNKVALTENTLLELSFSTTQKEMTLRESLELESSARNPVKKHQTKEKKLMRITITLLLSQLWMLKLQVKELGAQSKLRKINCF